MLHRSPEHNQSVMAPKLVAKKRARMARMRENAANVTGTLTRSQSKAVDPA
jgi:hypothetical protein